MPCGQSSWTVVKLGLGGGGSQQKPAGNRNPSEGVKALKTGKTRRRKSLTTSGRTLRFGAFCQFFHTFSAMAKEEKRKPLSRLNLERNLPRRSDLVSDLLRRAEATPEEKGLLDLELEDYRGGCRVSSVECHRTKVPPLDTRPSSLTPDRQTRPALSRPDAGSV
jgi:hypothetical protein